MLDFGLARVCGYETRYLNRQVKNNIQKFPEEFMFQLSEKEVREVVKCKYFTSPNTFFSGQEGGTRELPHAFTEQGIYMLMAVFKGGLATRQSIALIDGLKSTIYEIRGQKVMLDFEFVMIYGYETRTFNQQIRNNINKFPERYRFRLNKDEANSLRSKNLILNNPAILGERT